MGEIFRFGMQTHRSLFQASLMDAREYDSIGDGGTGKIEQTANDCRPAVEHGDSDGNDIGATVPKERSVRPMPNVMLSRLREYSPELERLEVAVDR